jgi:molybdate transport system substrate-binding protein
VRSEEANARATLAKIVLGEADAGLVYATDIRAAGDGVRAVPVPPEYNIAAVYVSAAVAGAGNPELATQFQAFLASESAQAILSSWGFGPPAATTS